MLNKIIIKLIASFLMLLIFEKGNAQKTQKFTAGFKRQELGIDIANALTFIK